MIHNLSWKSTELSLALREQALFVSLCEQKISPSRNYTYLPNIGVMLTHNTPYQSLEDKTYQTAIAKYFSLLSREMSTNTLPISASWLQKCATSYDVPMLAYKETLSPTVSSSLSMETDYLIADLEDAPSDNFEAAAATLLIRIGEFMSHLVQIPEDNCPLPCVKETNQRRKSAISLTTQFTSLINATVYQSTPIVQQEASKFFDAADALSLLLAPPPPSLLTRSSRSDNLTISIPSTTGIAEHVFTPEEPRAKKIKDDKKSNTMF